MWEAFARWMEGCMVAWMDGRMDEGMNGWMDQLMDMRPCGRHSREGWRDACMDE